MDQYADEQCAHIQRECNRMVLAAGYKVLRELPGPAIHITGPLIRYYTWSSRRPLSPTEIAFAAPEFLLRVDATCLHILGRSPARRDRALFRVSCTKVYLDDDGFMRIDGKLTLLYQ